MFPNPMYFAVLYCTVGYLIFYQTEVVRKCVIRALKGLGPPTCYHFWTTHSLATVQMEDTQSEH